MSIIDQTFETRLQKTFDMINSTPAMKPYRKQFKSQHFVLDGDFYIGWNKAVSTYLNTIPLERTNATKRTGHNHKDYDTDKDIQSDRIELTKRAFSQLERTDLVAYARSYHIGFPVGLGALKYYQATTDPSTVDIDPSGLLDLPGGAVKKLYQIIDQKDPFRFTLNEILCKIGRLL